VWEAGASEPKPLRRRSLVPVLLFGSSSSSFFHSEFPQVFSRIITHSLKRVCPWLSLARLEVFLFLLYLLLSFIRRHLVFSALCFRWKPAEPEDLRPLRLEKSNFFVSSHRSFVAPVGSRRPEGRTTDHRVPKQKLNETLGAPECNPNIKSMKRSRGDVLIKSSGPVCRKALTVHL